MFALVTWLWPYLTLLFFVLSEQIKVSVNDFIIKAAAVTLKVSIAYFVICSLNLLILMDAPSSVHL